MRRALGLVGLLSVLLLVGGCWLFAPPPAAPSVVSTPPVLRNVVFSQVDWFESDGTSVQVNSLYGLMRWTYDPDPDTTFYLNVHAALAADDAGSWVIQNLPLFAVDNDDFSAQRESVHVDLAEIGLVFDDALKLVFGIDVEQLYVAISVTADALDAFPDTTSELIDVGTVEYWASGNEDESPLPGPFVDPGRPRGVKVPGAPAKVNVTRDVRAVQETVSTCCAGAFARSIDWLNRTYELGMDKTAQQIYRDLIAAGVSKPNVDSSPARDEWIHLKNQYARAQTGDRIVTKVWDRGSDVSPVSGVTEETGDFLDWLKREIPTEDVELAYYYPGNAHIVTIVEAYTVGAKTFVKYRHDQPQGDDANGDEAVLHAEIYLKDGQYRFASDANIIYFAVSESVVSDEPCDDGTPGDPPCEGE